MEEIAIKLIGYQILAIGIIWAGMAFFFSEMTDPSKIIFYLVTSWLLFLIVLFAKGLIKSRKK